MSNNEPQVVSEEQNAQGLFSCQNDVSQATWQDGKDIFQREQYADQLSRLIQNTTCPYVIALSSSWGTGKSYFLHAWKHKVDWSQENKTNKIPCVYFSAWESEDNADPALAVVAEIKQTLEKKGLSEISSVMQTITQKTVQTITNPLAMLKMSGTVIKGFVNKNTDNALDDIGADFYEKHAEHLLDSFISQQKAKTSLKDELSKLVTKVKNQTSSPLLIMIDELDRCRPDYVIKLLEHIKHFFSIPGLVFVLAIDQKQLLSTVEHTFGLKDENREIYLEKFVDLFFHLPPPSLSNYAKSVLPLANFNFLYLPKNMICDFNTNYKNAYINIRITDLNDEDNKLHAYNIFIETIKFGLSDKDSLRSLEKKLSKFRTIVETYQPSFMEAMILLLCIMENLTQYNEQKLKITSHVISLRNTYSATFPKIKDSNELAVFSAQYIFNYAKSMSEPRLSFEPCNDKQNLLLLFIQNIYSEKVTRDTIAYVNTMLNFGKHIST